jgi:hypothetical protein
MITDARMLLERKTVIPTTENEAELYAYRTDRTSEELSSLLKSEEHKEHMYRSELESWMTHMSQKKVIPADTTESMLSVCLLGRLNTRLYPDMPQVTGLASFC